jgi:kynureninase|eukprot:COSAG01_NODE_10019_length_2273_cov_5.781509_2_plen_336_part_00
MVMAGNSLGVLPRGVSERLQQVVEKEWGRDLIRSWNTNGWMERSSVVGDKIGALVGGGQGNVVVADSTSVNLFKALGAALQLQQARAAAQAAVAGASEPTTPRRHLIISEAGNFPTDLYMIQGMLGLLTAGGEGSGGHALKTVAVTELEAELEGEAKSRVAVVCLTHINYRSGRMHDMAAITKRVHAAGALMIWDLAHSAGAVEVDLLGSGADFAFGCGYKYLNGGPGAPAFIWCHPSLQADVRSPLAGWLGHARPFAFVPDYEPAAGIGRFVCGTPNVLSEVALDVALDAWDGVTMAQVRAKSVALGDFFIRRVESRCAAFCHAGGASLDCQNY